MTPESAFWHASTNTPIPDLDALLALIQTDIQAAKVHVVADGLIANGYDPAEAQAVATLCLQPLRQPRHA